MTEDSGSGRPPARATLVPDEARSQLKAASSCGPVKMRVTIEQWARREPFRIAGYVFTDSPCIVVEVEAQGLRGRGEAAGVYYLGETCDSMVADLEAVRPAVEAGASRAELLDILPAGGARNALDCALWDLEAQVRGMPVWSLAGLPAPKPLLTTFTCGADTPERMAEAAIGFPEARAIKLKLTGDEEDAARVTAVRDALPSVWLSVDANQGFTRASLEDLMPTLLACDVKMIEQPFPLERDALLDGLQRPIPIASDESVQTSEDIARLTGRFDLINIKLDKSGGLTEALVMARIARSAGLGMMVGCMGGTSLAMAPAWLFGQLCDVVDLDGPPSLRKDRSDPVRYDDGFITAPSTLWGAPR